MFCRFVALLLLSAFIQAQTTQETERLQPETQNQGNQEPSLQDWTAFGAPATSTPSEGKPLVVSSYTRHNQLRRERDEEVAVVLCKPMVKSLGCPLGGLSQQTELEPLTLELKPGEGFNVRYREGKEFRQQQQGPAVPTEIGLKVFRLKVRAGDNVALGRHTLEGKLTFRKCKGRTTSEVQQIDITIPVTVVNHDAHVVEANWSLERPGKWGVGSKILLAVTAPIWGPVFLAWVAAYAISGGD